MRDRREICGTCKHHKYGAVYEGDTIRSGWKCDIDGYATDYHDSCDEFEPREENDEGVESV